MTHCKIAIPGKIMLKPKKNHKTKGTADRILSVQWSSPNQKIVKEILLQKNRQPRTTKKTTCISSVNLENVATAHYLFEVKKCSKNLLRNVLPGVRSKIIA